ncbi:sigma-54-dependent transcriptional regulator [Limnovirga soli]|uniref:Response regulator n=1 Tax=Limnovirga soli TaxID=2656915 RepID=A0A8J8FHB0_9BACT|nr:sigma-54 dependent transcriptional regulator [Limnovirga soli]NNV57868.1 response regulator [Limnovirga soli]
MKQETISIYIVEDDAVYSAVLGHFLSLNPDFKVKKFFTAKEFLAALPDKPDIVTLDYTLPDSNGDQLLAKVKEVSPATKVIIISGQEDIKIAIDLFKKGANDYIVKDADTQERLWLSINQLRENIALKKEVANLQQEVQSKYNFQNAIIGNSYPLKSVFALMEKAASTNITVSITGETGTGKDLVAKAIHFNSDKRKAPFVPVNVAAIPRELLESELFGHEKGAFTGAISRRIGKFEEANNGTLFLDEIGEMDISMQAKLLRVLQEQEITRVGSNELLKINVRIIVATHRNLMDQVKKGKFREDLFYRLLGLPIHLPPLRERGSDIILIAKHFIDKFCTENNLGKKSLDIAAKKKLMLYSFPGNIRELKSVVELASVMSEGEEINETHIQLNSNMNNEINSVTETLTLKQFTSQLIQHYLDTNEYDVLKVAEILDVGKSTIYRMVNNNELKLQRNTDNK